MLRGGRAGMQKEDAIVFDLKLLLAGMMLDATLECKEDELLAIPQFGPSKGSINRFLDMSVGLLTSPSPRTQTGPDLIDLDSFFFTSVFKKWFRVLRPGFRLGHSSAAWKYCFFVGR